MKVKELMDVLSGCDPELDCYYNGYEEISEVNAAYETDERSVPYERRKLLVLLT